ncbi:hypothetical protein [Micromonospora sp. RP3T]|uniref:hypothetical protein n=1 Tax=Micromonospora sp. RP3T TaxID=2135446 RepID=UPI003D75A789
MTAGEGPDNNWAVHDCGYAPLLTGGRLVKKYDPAWQLKENGPSRSPESLQRFVTYRAFHDRAHKQPGYGLGYHHSIHPRGELPGYPDCHMWAPKPGGQMFRELKGMGDFPRVEQVAVLSALAATGADVGVWWSCCWYAGRIDRELAALAGADPIGQHWAPGLPPQPGQAGYAPPPVGGLNESPAAVVVPRQRSRNRGHADRLAPRTAAADMPPPELPGGEVPAGFAALGGVGYLVPMPDGVLSAGLDRWLREQGFPPVVVPWPLRVVVGGGGVVVQCRPGGHGRPRMWRWAPGRRDFPEALALAVGADVIHAPAGHLLELLADAVPSRDLAAAQ